MMTTELNIGDEVRFLNDVGGGRISGFRKGGIVLVEDEDGFEMPVLQTEVVRAEKREPLPQPTPKPKKPKPEQEEEPTEEERRIAELNNTLEARVIRLEIETRRLRTRLERLENVRAEKEKSRVMHESLTARQRKGEALEIDLHAAALLETTAGLTAADIKDYQVETARKALKEHSAERGQRIVLIHGNGEGALRRAILEMLRREFPRFEAQDASFQQYGFGATMVTVK